MTTPVSSASSNSGTTNILNLSENRRMAILITGNAFFNIPTPIISDIFARLTTDEVGRCRCVSKTWLELLSQPEFVDLHLSKSQTGLIVHNDPDPSDSLDSAAFSLVEIEDETNQHGVRYKAQIHREIPRSSQTTAIHMIGSVNGLVCICESQFQYDLIHVWNPIMKEFITIQTPAVGIMKEFITIQTPALGEKGKFCSVVTYGFGISSGKYHVVRIFQKIELKLTVRHHHDTTMSHQILDSTCHIYTVGTGFWKNVGHAPYFHKCRPQGLFLNGNLHWLASDENMPQICCLDLQSESFRPIPPPPELPHQGLLVTLNDYKGCISVCDNTSDYDTVIWVMKEYGVQNSWTKEVVMSKYLIDRFGNHYSVVRIIKVFEDGEILLLWGANKLFSYHPNTKTVQNLDVQETMTGPSSNPYIEARAEFVSSIVSLKNLGEVNVYRA